VVPRAAAGAAIERRLFGPSFAIPARRRARDDDMLVYYVYYVY
jgi:hypothetical protein